MSDLRERLVTVLRDAMRHNVGMGQEEWLWETYTPEAVARVLAVALIRAGVTEDPHQAPATKSVGALQDGRYYVAVCADCGDLQMPFAVEAERDTWVKEHGSIGHKITTGRGWSVHDFEPDVPCDFADAHVLDAEATADYCYAHQQFCEPFKPRTEE